MVAGRKRLADDEAVAALLLGYARRSHHRDASQRMNHVRAPYRRPQKTSRPMNPPNRRPPHSVYLSVTVATEEDPGGALENAE